MSSILCRKPARKGRKMGKDTTRKFLSLMTRKRIPCLRSEVRFFLFFSFFFFFFFSLFCFSLASRKTPLMTIQGSESVWKRKAEKHDVSTEHYRPEKNRTESARILLIPAFCIFLTNMNSRYCSQIQAKSRIPAQNRRASQSRSTELLAQWCCQICRKESEKRTFFT